MEGSTAGTKKLSPDDLTVARDYQPSGVLDELSHKRYQHL